MKMMMVRTLKFSLVDLGKKRDELAAIVIIIFVILWIQFCWKRRFLIIKNKLSVEKLIYHFNYRYRHHQKFLPNYISGKICFCRGKNYVCLFPRRAAMPNAFIEKN